MKSRVLLSNSVLLPASVAFMTLVFAAVGPSILAQAQDAGTFRGVRIDVSGMPQGAGFARAQMQACLSRYVPAALGGRINPGARSAPVLVVRPFTLTLVENSTSDDSGGGGGSDMMEGEAIIGSTRIPVLVTGAGLTSSPAFAESIARQRMDTLCSSFAYWLARKV